MTERHRKQIDHLKQKNRDLRAELAVAKRENLLMRELLREKERVDHLRLKLKRAGGL